MALPSVSFYCCGGTQIRRVRLGETLAEEWLWDSTTAPGLTDDQRAWFRSMDEIKPGRDGLTLLATASGSGGAVVIRLFDGMAVFKAPLRNAHSIESFPGGWIVAAGSIGSDALVLYSESDAQEAARIALGHAHGIVYDSARGIGWALGDDRLLAVSVRDGSIDVLREYRVPDKDAHDLNPSRTAPGYLDITTPNTVFRFDPESGCFEPHPVFAGRADIKSIDDLPDGRWVYQQAIGGKQWWNDRISFINDDRLWIQPGVRLYKARWAVANPFRG